MTVTYTSEVSTAKNLGIFWKLLFRWRGSIYKLIWPEMTLFITLYYVLRVVYEYALNPDQRQLFEAISVYCHNSTTMIPLTFVLGFYVNVVMTRWWDQYKMIPWPDNLAVFVSTSIHGLDERGRLMRRTIMRYVNLSFVMTLSMISRKVKKRFPTKEHLVAAGILTKNEKMIFENLDELYPNPKYWMPLVWAGTIASRARREGRIRDDFALKTILDAINTFRSRCGGLISYDTISVPLVYTQVVTLAVYTYFLGSLMGRQFLDPSKQHSHSRVDLYFPLFTILQFLFYMGWLKVAETLINPFGEDDDDFEINWIIDRHIQLSYLIVDGMHREHPEMVQDKYWDEGIPQELPYTVASEQFKTDGHSGSTSCMDIPQSQQYFLRNAAPADDDCSQVQINMAKNVQKRDDESDVDSVLWVTPRSIPRTQSILSTIMRRINQGAQGQQPPRATRQLSNDSAKGQTRLRKNGSNSNIESSNYELKTMNQFPEKKVESAIFKLSLESLKEEDTETSTSEEQEQLLQLEKGLLQGTNPFLPQQQQEQQQQEQMQQQQQQQEEQQQQK